MALDAVHKGNFGHGDLQIDLSMILPHIDMHRKSQGMIERMRL